VRVSLGQGDIHCSAEPSILVTVLGSCVAVCLWDPIRRVGGMNHFVLPTDPHGEKSARYGDFAVDKLVDRMQRLGCKSVGLQAKVFGGAAVLPFAGGESVGSNNVRVALERLRDHRIPVTVQRTGGTLGQQIRFLTNTGEVFFRYLSGSTPGTGATGPLLRHRPVDPNSSGDSRPVANPGAISA
jgi:chemotaxis protein CheD